MKQLTAKFSQLERIKIPCTSSSQFLSLSTKSSESLSHTKENILCFSSSNFLPMSSKLFSLLFTTTILLLHSTHAIEFTFLNFNSTHRLLLYGNATIESSVLTLTNDTTFSIGRALYPSKILTTPPNSSHLIPFSTSFIFSISPVQNRLPGHGFAFIFVPFIGINGASSAQHLGLLNLTNDGKSDNHVFAVEFDVFKNQEFNDINDNHVGINVNSLASVASQVAGYWYGNNDEDFKELKLNNGVNYQAWIDYSDSMINVTMTEAGMARPNKPLISASLNLSGVLLNEMYVGFTGATGQVVESHRILSWCFGPWNSSIGDGLATRYLPSFVVSNGSVFRSKGFIIGVSVGSFVFILGFAAVVFVILLWRKRGKKDTEDWELEYWPHRIGYQEIEAATKGFSEKNVIGFGGNGKVYKGVLVGGLEVAVKRISLESGHGMNEFLAEVSSLGRLKHRNLVGLRGWCKREKGSLILVYDYMVNGSLDKRVFDCKESMMLNWDERVKVLKDVASGVLYLHEGWEVKVLHRDLKASNVLLDNDMNARLGDFGLARMHQHEQLSNTTLVAGTVGYMAPEVVRTGRPSAQTDVFGFGVLVLEVACGRRPIEEGKPGLVDWVWSLMEKGELFRALDERLKTKGGYIDEEEVERVLHLGLLCVYPDPQVRPTMRQVVKALECISNEGSQGTESEGEGMEINLLDKVKTREMWSKYRRNIGEGRHPTFEEIQNSLSSSSTSTGSYVVEGR